MRVPFEEMQNQFNRVLLKKGFTPERAALCARLFAEASRDGVYSHGLNCFPRFISYIDQGYIDIHAEPVFVEKTGVLERWDGRMGPGNLNAWFCMNRAVAIAKEHGVGCVAIRHTNHWMRAGTYGLQAVEAGCIGICWTNTTPNMPAWGGTKPQIGNNPIVFAVPHPKGPILLDMAASMFSYGKLEQYANQGKMLPVDGGFDNEGRLTKDPRAILETQRLIPIGYWKGSGLSLVLDLIAVFLSNGNSTYEVGKLPSEIGLSQVFLAFNPGAMSGTDAILRSIEQTLDDLNQAGESVFYPGQRMMQTRADNLEHGIPVDLHYWNTVLAM
ncbi:MAG TPA: 3-dehydro-L-gulonate 2-dehydrogenase [Thermoguttaceae bacterium]|nr:3-dehydro-L-gulonate 2-dehydrogenase [Thermoguttaceae bacterium]